jgi:hypothetical protein
MMSVVREVSAALATLMLVIFKGAELTIQEGLTNMESLGRLKL